MALANRSISLTLLDKVNVCLEDFGDHVMHLVFDVQGKVDIKRLQQAIQLSLTQHPIMSMYLEMSGLQPRWVFHNKQTLSQLTLCELVSGVPPQSAIDEFMLKTFDYQRVPMVNVRVIRHNTDTICIKVSCVPIDGRGFLIYVEDLLAIYEELRLNPAYRPHPGTLEQRSTKALVSYFKIPDVFALLYYGLRHQITDSRTAGNWQVPCNISSELKPTYYCHQCAPGTLATLNLFRKQYQLSFNDVLLGAYYLALYEWIQPQSDGPFCVLNTYDLRRYEADNAPDRVANYSSFINSNIVLQPNASLLQAALAVRDAVGQRKHHFPGITEGPFIWPLLTFLPFKLGSAIVKFLLKHRGEKIPVFTNVGVIPIARMLVNGKPIRNVRPYAPLEFPPKLTVTLATSGDIISFSVGYSENHFPTDRIQQLFKRMEQLIRATCTNPATEVA
ncbi:MAG: hypothetical protein D9N11_05170 [Ketobacter sp.]|nr:MAG: hypothetical protein D9N11_05170 [Ketobacter sp.]